MGAFANPFDPDKLLWSGCPCGQHRSLLEHNLSMSAQNGSPGARFYCQDVAEDSLTDSPADVTWTRESTLPHSQTDCHDPNCRDMKCGEPVRPAGGRAETPSRADRPFYEDDEPDGSNMEETLVRCVESAVVQGIFGTDMHRRLFLRAVGAGTAAAAISQIFPLGAAKAVAAELKGVLEKTKLNVGFVPITCATPIIMAHPMGFYKKYGLDVDVIKTAGWAVARDKSLSGEYDAAHMLTPMPLSITMGTGSVARPWTMPAVENINGQAITLAMKHKDNNDPRNWKGFKFAVPFEFSMHNFLLRYYLAEHGLDPDKDVQIRVLPPPEMVANMRADNVDGYLSPDPFNQRAVYDGVGFIHILTKDIWDKHPCCAFAASEEFIQQNPNTFLALFKSIIEATNYASDTGNRKEISKAIAPKNYLNQPVTVIEQVLTGTFADGLGNIRRVPDRIDFDPFPWHSMGVWILTQMKRWGYVKGDLDYKKVAEEVYLATDAQRVMTEMGLLPPKTTYAKYSIMGKSFDPGKPEDYVQSFAIKRT